MSKEINVYEQLFNLFIDDAREEKDIQHAAKTYIADLVHLWTTNLGPVGAAKFRGFSVSPSTQRAEDGTNQVLVCLRGFDLQGKKIITFANGPSFEVAAFSWLHAAVNNDTKWKPDEDKRGSYGVNSLIDAVGSTKE